jgi:SpoVK/Ycf46/Vps4 family AAA+-type ATPase
LWTSNNISDIDAAILRRMILAFQLKAPPTAQRRRIIKRMANRIGVKLSSEEIAKLASKLEATPAIMENALKVAKYSGGGAKAIERAAEGITRAVSGLQAHRSEDIFDYDPKLSKASRNIHSLSKQLKASGKLNFSLCLSGPPGTGKSAYARFLAKELGLEVIQKRASDIFSAFIGETEKRIADAFLEAREARAFLIFDEADSFLYSRQEASRSWEVTQVNEMLTWMEEHTLPVCFTTNLMDRLDNASLRRFTFHVRFSYMDEEALMAAYDIFFNLKEIPERGLKFTNLTPGDFAQVSKQAEVLGAEGDIDRIIELLSEVSRTKPGQSENIGFMN